jgi:hypothetical protein
VEERKSKFAAAPAFFRGKKEFAHFHGPNEIDIRVTKAKIRSLNLLKAGDKRLSFENKAGDWVAFQFTEEKDLEHCFKLVEVAYRANKGP